MYAERGPTALHRRTWLTTRGLVVLAALSILALFTRRGRNHRDAARPAGDAASGGEPQPEIAEAAEQIGERGDSGLYERVPAETRYRKRPLGERWKERFLGRAAVPLPSYIGLIEDPPTPQQPKRTGICCSGGGIRSA